MSNAFLFFKDSYFCSSDNHIVQNIYVNYNDTKININDLEKLSVLNVNNNQKWKMDSVNPIPFFWRICFLRILFKIKSRVSNSMLWNRWIFSVSDFSSSSAVIASTERPVFSLIGQTVFGIDMMINTLDFLRLVIL